MTKQEFVEACAGVGVFVNPNSMRIYRNFTYSHQLAYATLTFDGDINEVVMLDEEVDHDSHKALRTLIMVHGLKKRLATKLEKYNQ